MVDVRLGSKHAYGSFTNPIDYRDVFWTLSNICNGAFSQKQLAAKIFKLISRKIASEMLNKRVLNTPLEYQEL